MSCIMSYARCFPDMPSIVVADGTGTSRPCINSLQITDSALSTQCQPHLRVCCQIIRHVAACIRNAVFNRSCIKHPKCNASE